MRKTLLAIALVALLAAVPAFAVGPPGSGGGNGVLTDTNCNQAKYFAIGVLCQDTDDGKLYKGTGAAVSEITAGVGIAADGSTAFTGAPVPNAANTIAIGSATAEWADLYLGDGAVIYGQNDQSNTLTSAATGWSAALLFTANAGLAVKQGSTGAGFIDIYEDSDDGTNKIRLQAQAMAGDLTYILPSAAIARGSILKGSSTANTLDWLAVGASGKVITTDGTDPSWSAYTVAAPGSAGAVLYSDGTNWTRSASPALTSANLTGANALGLGTASTNAGAINFKNATNANELVLQSGVTAATITYTLPTAAPAANGAVLTGNTDGTLAFNVNPALSTLNLTGANTLGLGTAGSAVGSINFKNATSGSITVQPITGALGTPTLVLGTTYTDGKWCSYATATGFTCNQNAPAGAGDFLADGTVAMTGALNAAQGLKVGQGSTGPGYIQLMEDSDNGTDYSSITGAADAGSYPAFTFAGSQGSQTAYLQAASSLWTWHTGASGATFAFTPLVTLNAGLAVKNGATGPGFINLYEDSDDGSNYVAIKSQAMAANYDLVLPASLGAANTLVGMNSGGTALEFKSTISATLDNSAAQFADSSVATKKMKIDPSGMTATKTATIAGACTDDCTITLPSATATLATTGANTFGGTQALGANNLTMTGSIAATGSRVTKGWFTDIESTNMPTVGGTAVLTSLTAPQFTTIELGHASDTTLARSAAGVVTIEGATVHTFQTTIDGSAHVHLTAAQMKNPNCHVSNYGQTTADVSIGLPTAEANLSCLFTVSTAQSNHWGVLADTNDAIYIIAADGTVGSKGTDGAAAIMTAAQLGQSFSCWSIQTGASAWDWLCKSISIGTSTFTTHAAY